MTFGYTPSLPAPPPPPQKKNPNRSSFDRPTHFTQARSLIHGRGGGYTKSMENLKIFTEMSHLKVKFVCLLFT